MDTMRCLGNDGGCCTEETPCEKYDGDCDSNSDCKGDLICGENNCNVDWLSDSEFDETDDCCMENLRCLGNDGGCCTEETPCEKYDGDCDSDSDCKGDLICGENNCNVDWHTDSEFDESDDCCTPPPRCFGHNEDCCTEATPCIKNQGDW